MSNTTNETGDGVGDNASCPLWKFVTVTVPAKKGDGGNCAFTCNFCKVAFTGSHYRVKLHLLKITGKGIRICKSISDDKRREVERLVEEYETRKKKQGLNLFLFLHQLLMVLQMEVHMG